MGRNNRTHAARDYETIIMLHNKGLDNCTIQAAVRCSRSKVKDCLNFYRHAQNRDFRFFWDFTEKYQKKLMAEVAMKNAGVWDEYQAFAQNRFRKEDNANAFYGLSTQELLDECKVAFERLSRIFEILSNRCENGNDGS